MKAIKLVFPEGKFKALTFSYDDGVLSDRRLVELFNRYYLKGTFHLNSGLLGTAGKLDAQEVKSLYEGHEVACHSLSHPSLTRLPNEAILEELLVDRKMLESYVDYPVKGFSYPYGVYNTNIKQLLPMLGLDYARVVPSTGQFELPDDWYEWKPTCHHNDQLLDRGRAFIDMQRPQYLSLMYVWGHSYEFDGDGNWDVMEQFCAQMSEQDNIWFATNIDIRHYMRRFEGLQFTANGAKVYNPFAKSVWLKVDDQIIEATGGALTTLR